MWCTPKVKATFGVLFMTKISKQIKLQAIQDYLSGKYSIRGITARYGIANSVFRMLIAAYKSFGPDILFNPPAITPEFRIKVASWAIQNNASHSQVAAKFGYTGIAQIVSWKKIYSQLGPNGLLSIQKGRSPRMPHKKPKQVKQLTETEKHIAQLEDENLRLKIENEALKLLASIQQRTDNSQK